VRSPRKKVFDEIVALQTKGFLRNPAKAIAASIKGIRNVRKIQLMVNGFQGKNTYTLGELANYLKHVVVRELREEAEEEGRRLTQKSISDTFQLKIIHGSKRTKR
jgi:hypothetical protein